MLLTHAYVHWAANVLLAVFAPAFPLSLGRQEIRPQTAQAHSLGRQIAQKPPIPLLQLCSKVQ